MRAALSLIVWSALVVGTGAAEVVWDHLPWAVYSEEQLDLSGELPAGWHLRPAGRAALPDEGDVDLHLPAAGLDGIDLIDAEGRRTGGILLLRPGEGGALDVVGGRLVRDDALVVLTLSRLEHVEDRRWKILRASRDEGATCGTRLTAPEVPLGESGLLALIAAARRAPIWQAGVLVELPSSDRLVGWNHRAYRQSLAWLVADLWQRGAARVVLVQGPVPKVEAESMAPFWRQARDVARTYRCDLVEVPDLLDEDYWRVGAGLLGETLNDAGQAALDELCARYMDGG